MADLIVFSVGSNKYALDIEHVQRIIQSQELTNIPNAHKLVDGIMSYEESVLKVVSFRNLIGLQSYKAELQELFEKLKKGHGLWVDDLKHSLETGKKFTKTTNPRMCELGLWIDSFTSYDDRVTEVLSTLVAYHKQLHTRGGDALELYLEDKEAALKIFNVEILTMYEHTMGALSTFMEELDTVANSLQKMLIYENNEKLFAIRVDTIEDIAHIEEGQIISSSEDDKQCDFLDLEGVLDIDGVLINVIKSVKLPS